MNKQGFTLIELLAVIVILGIITLIAIPSVSNIIKNSKERVALANAKTFLSEVDKYAIKHDLDPGTYTFDLKGKTLNISDGNDDYPPLKDIINMSGTAPSSGTVTINEKGKVTESTMHYSSTDKTILYLPETGYTIKTPKIVLADGTVVYFNPKENKVCSESDYNANTNASVVENKSGCMKWYAFLDNKNSETTNLLLDHNTSLYIASDDTVDGELTTLQNNWKNVKVRLIDALEIAKITGAYETLSWQETSTSPWFYLDGADGKDDTWKTGVANSTIKSKYAWLYNNSFTCERYGCTKEDNTSNLSVRYFTSFHYRFYKGGYIYWVVSNSGILTTNFNVGSNIVMSSSIRPVIEVNSSLITK